MLILDEYSTIGALDLGFLLQRVEEIFGQHVWQAVVVLAGDHLQVQAVQTLTIPEACMAQGLPGCPVPASARALSATQSLAAQALLSCCNIVSLTQPMRAARDPRLLALHAELKPDFKRLELLTPKALAILAPRVLTPATAAASPALLGSLFACYDKRTGHAVEHERATLKARLQGAPLISFYTVTTGEERLDPASLQALRDLNPVLCLNYTPGERVRVGANFLPQLQRHGLGTGANATTCGIEFDESTPEFKAAMVVYMLAAPGQRVIFPFPLAIFVALDSSKTEAIEASFPGTLNEGIVAGALAIPVLPMAIREKVCVRAGEKAVEVACIGFPITLGNFSTFDALQGRSLPVGVPLTVCLARVPSSCGAHRILVALTRNQSLDDLYIAGCDKAKLVRCRFRPLVLGFLNGMRVLDKDGRWNQALALDTQEALTKEKARAKLRDKAADKAAAGALRGGRGAAAGNGTRAPRGASAGTGGAAPPAPAAAKARRPASAAPRASAIQAGARPTAPAPPAPRPTATTTATATATAPRPTTPSTATAPPTATATSAASTAPPAPRPTATAAAPRLNASANVIVTTPPAQVPSATATATATPAPRPSATVTVPAPGAAAPSASASANATAAPPSPSWRSASVAPLRPSPTAPAPAPTSSALRAASAPAPASRLAPIFMSAARKAPVVLSAYDIASQLAIELAQRPQLAVPAAACGIVRPRLKPFCWLIASLQLLRAAQGPVDSLPDLPPGPELLALLGGVEGLSLTAAELSNLALIFSVARVGDWTAGITSHCA